MPERQTLITSGQNTRIQPLAAPNVHAPSGAFGDTSGMQTFGRAAQSVGDDFSQLQRQRQAMDRHLRDEGDRRDASDIHQRLRLAVDQEDTAAAQSISEAMSKGLRGDDLLKTVDEVGRQGAKNIDARLADLRKRNPKMYAEVASQATKDAEWGVRMNRLQEKVTEHNVRLDLQDRIETTTQQDQMDFSKVATSPSGALAAYGHIVQDNEVRKNLLPFEVRNQRLGAARQQVQNVLEGAAMNTPSIEVIKASEIARDNGIIPADAQARIADTVRRGLDPKVHVAEIRSVASEMNEKLKGGAEVGIEGANEVLGHALSTYTDPTAKFEQAVKPRVLALMEGKLRSGTNSGLFDGRTFQSAQKLLAALDDPSSAEIDHLFAQQFKDRLFDQFNATPGLQKAVEGTKSYEASATDLAHYKETLRASLTKQLELVEKGRVYDLYKNDEGFKAVVATGNADKIVHAQEMLYDRDEIPLDKRVYGSPAELDALGAQVKMTGEAEANKTATMVQSFTERYGKKSFGALLSIAQNSGDAPMGGLVRFAAQQFMAETPEDAQNIAGFVPQLAQAMAWSQSKAGQEALKVDPAYDKRIQDFWRMSFSASFAEEYKPGAAFMAQKEGEKFPAEPVASAMGKAAIREGTFDSLYNMGLALTRFYAVSQPDEYSAPNKAAAKARSVLGAAFVPLITNGGNNDNPIYAFGPVANSSTDWMSPGRKSAYNSQRHFMQIDTAAFDSMFFASDPKFQSLGNLQWDVNSAMAMLLSGPRVGSNATVDREGWLDGLRRWSTTMSQAPNLDTAFTALVQTNPHTKAFNPKPIDFANVGILSPDGKFMPLSDPRVHTGVIPEDLREKVQTVLKRVDETDVAGRNQIVLANAYQRVANEGERRWDIYLSSGRNYVGNAGNLTKTAPRVQIVVNKGDGTYEPLSVSFQDHATRREALMAAASFTPRAGVKDRLGEEIRLKPVMPIIEAALKKEIEAKGRVK